MKKSKWTGRLVAAAALAAVLVFAFWYGGGTPTTMGWSAGTVSAAQSGAGEENPKTAPVAADSTPDGEPDTLSAEADYPAASAENPPPALPEGELTAPNDPADDVAKEQPAAPPQETQAEEAQAEEVQQEAEAPVCTLTVRCDEILAHLDWLTPEKVDLVPEDGLLYANTTLSFEEGDTVLDVLSDALRQAGIHMEFADTPLYQSSYVEGIGNLYEFDCGPQSGWTYLVNGSNPGYGCSQYKLKPGDVVEWRYTCDLGTDTGAV